MNKNYLKISLIFLLAFLLVGLVSIIDKAGLVGLDHIVLRKLEAIRTGPLNYIMNKITGLANTVSIIFVVATTCFVLYLKSHKSLAFWYLALCLIAIVGLGLGLKILIQRPRPDEIFRIAEVASSSFPSGHSLSTVVVYGGLAYILGKFFKTKKKVFLGLGLGISLLIGFSRLYLGVHFLSDVIAGLSLGAWSLFLGIYIYEVRYGEK